MVSAGRVERTAAVGRLEQVLLGLIYFAGGFLAATFVLYSELRAARRKAAMLEKMNDRHNARILACKTGSVRFGYKVTIAETRQE